MKTSSIPAHLTNDLAAATNELRDLKPPVDIPSGWEWLWWTLGAIAALGLLALAIIALMRLIQRRRQPALVPVLPPHERARQKLQAALDFLDQPKPFCILVSDAIRLYLEERFGLQAPERTTEEFLDELRGQTVLTPPQKDSLEQFLSACDLVKFARHQPGTNELQGLYQSALNLIEETEPKPATPPDRSAIRNPQSAMP